jgi:hypothetical protein
MSVQNVMPKTVLDFSIELERSERLLNERIGSKPIAAELVRPEEVRAPLVYKRFLDTEKKEAFRADLLNCLEESVSAVHGPEKGRIIREEFVRLADDLDRNGAFVLGSIIQSEDFRKLIEAYTQIIEGSGSKSWIHAYVNLANHPDFLTNKEFNSAFLHPLLIALVSYRIGGPVRIVDGRGKDAEPISVLAQDNMLHIDNTPFNDEYKIILTWKKGEPLGPQGQNFVFLPGTHKGVRQCMGEKHPWSSENASIFITPDSVERMLDFQQKVIGKRSVVEVTHPDKPLTTLFAAGSLVHHRHRTESGLSRSCMILAFHRAEDNPGQLIDESHLEKTAAATDILYQRLFGKSGSDEEYLKVLMGKSAEMVRLLDSMSSEPDCPEQIQPEAKELGKEDIQAWIGHCTEAPSVAVKKAEKNVVPLGKEFENGSFVEHVSTMMTFDKHGPLDLILYPDAHEEIRKWARNQIREKEPALLHKQIEEDWSESIEQPEEKHLLTPLKLKEAAEELAKIAEENIDSPAFLNPNEKISSKDAMRSIHQLLLDLGEAVVRCEDSTSFLSTSLFIFFAADTLMRLNDGKEERVKELGTALLQNYIATAVLVEKQTR